MNQGKKLNKIAGIIILAFLVGGVLFSLYMRYQLFHHYAFTTGKVRGITVGRGRESYTILYDYWVSNSQHHGEQTFDYCPGWGMANAAGLNH